MAKRLKIAIVGGGISGLTSAYFLLQERLDKSLEIDISLLERSDRLGGVIRSERIGDCLL